MATTGRPEEFTPEKRQRFIQLVRAGAFKKDAARLSGVHRDTVYKWLRLGKGKKRGKYAEFRAEVEAAEGEVRLTLLHALREAGKGDWRAIETYGRIRFPKEFTMKQHVKAEVSGPEGGPIPVGVVALPELEDPEDDDGDGAQESYEDDEES